MAGPDPVYADMALFKSALHITDTDRDTLITQALAASSRGIDRDTGRRFWLDAAPGARVINPRGKVLPSPDGGRLLTADIGTLEGLVVEVGAAGSWSDVTANVEAEPTDALGQGLPVTSLLYLGAPWPAGPRQRVRVTARWGWPAVPDVVQQAALIQATRLFKRKDSPEGVTGSAEWGVVRLSRIDPDVSALIKNLMLPGIA